MRRMLSLTNDIKEITVTADMWNEDESGFVLNLDGNMPQKILIKPASDLSQHFDEMPDLYINFNIPMIIVYPTDAESNVNITGLESGYGTDYSEGSVILSGDNFYGWKSPLSLFIFNGFCYIEINNHEI